VQVPHDGNAQVCRAEARSSWAAIGELTAGAWTDRDGVTRPLGPEDMIVVAPDDGMPPERTV
jgi:uncharacterized protein